MGQGVLLFDNVNPGTALSFIQDDFADITVPANSNLGFSNTPASNPLQHFYGNDDTPRYGAKILWLKDIQPIANRALWINDRPTYDIIWHEDFPQAKGYCFGAVQLNTFGAGKRLDLNRVGDSIGVGGVIARVMWIVESDTGAGSSGQLALDGVNTTTIDFSSGSSGWDGQPKFNAYVAEASNETRNIHDFRLSALPPPGNCKVTGVIVYYELGSSIDCFGGTSYLNKTQVMSTGTTLALPSFAAFRGGLADIYKTSAGGYAATTSLVADIATIATGSSGTNLLSVTPGTGGSFLAGNFVYAAVGATQYIGNVLIRSSDTLTMGVTLPFGVSSTLYQLFRCGDSLPISQTLLQKSFEFYAGATQVVGISAVNGILAFSDPQLNWRVWGATLGILGASAIFNILGMTQGIDLNQASSFVQVDGRFQALEFEFLSGISAVLQATISIDGIPAFNYNENVNEPGIFRRTIMLDAGMGWHSVVMKRAAGFTQLLLSSVVGYQSKVYNGPSFGVLSELGMGQTFLQRNAQNATLTAFGDYTRYFADSINFKGPWGRGTTAIAAGGVYFAGATGSCTGRFGYYGSAAAIVGALGNSLTINIDGSLQGQSFNTWIGLSLSNGFHVLDFTCNGGTTRIDAIDVLSTQAKIRNTQNFGPLAIVVDNQTLELE